MQAADLHWGTADKWGKEPNPKQLTFGQVADHNQANTARSRPSISGQLKLGLHPILRAVFFRDIDTIYSLWDAIGSDIIIF